MLASISLQNSERKWGPFGWGPTSAAITIGGRERYRLRCLFRTYSRTVTYQLIDEHNQLLVSCSSTFDGKHYLIDLPFVANHPLQYRCHISGRAVFCLPNEEVSASFSQTQNRRHFSLDGMKFEHLDFSSEVQLRCPEARLPQAIFVANFLFNFPPFLSDS